MRELMQDLYSSNTQMSIVPLNDSVLIKFHNNTANSGTSYMLSSFDLGDSPISMEKYVGLLLDGFLKQLGDYRRSVK